MKYQHMNRMAMLALLLFVTTTTQAFTIAPSNSPRKRKAFDKQKPSSPSSNSAHPQAEEHKHKVARFVPNGHSQPSSSQATALAAFAAAMAPLAANAGDVAEVDAIGYGVGLVATVVSLAVGFAVGYGTLAE